MGVRLNIKVLGQLDPLYFLSSKLKQKKKRKKKGANKKVN